MTDIYIVGLGVNSVQQLTREAEQAIRASNEVLYLDTGVATRQFLGERCGRITPLYETSYREGGHRLNAYQLMAAQVIEAALDHAPVTFAIHGHPVVAVYAPFLVADLAGLLDLSVSIQPGVSAMDAIFAELRIDPCIHGLQMYEATDLLLRKRPLQPDVPALIWQIGNLETVLHTTRTSRPERFDRFVTHLLNFYPASHRAIAIYTPPHPLMPATRIEFELGSMREHAARIHAGFSLYIPSARHRPIEDTELLGLLQGADHLAAITYDD